jgi:hypothetical protein
MPIIPALRWLRQEGQKFKTSLGYLARLYLKKSKINKRQGEKCNHTIASPAS